MKNALVSVILVALLLAGFIGGAINFSAIAQEPEYKYLWIKYSPLEMPEPATDPPVGEHAFVEGWSGKIYAPEIVNVTEGVRWVFVKWVIYGNESGSVWEKPEGQLWADINMVENQTAVAYYKLQYLFTVVTPFDTAWIFDGSAWHTEYDESISMWFDNGTRGVKAGLSTGQVDIAYAHRAYFVGWGGDVTGDPDSPITGSQHSDPVNMTGPKTAIANWVEKYYLYTDSSYYPWDGGSPYDPDKEGYYPEGTDVELTAPKYDQVYPGHYRWRFDRWEIEKWNYTSGAWELAYTEHTENITVHIDAPITATVYFHLQYYLTVKVSPSALESTTEGQEIMNQSDYYDYCSDVTLTADEYIYISNRERYRFDHWHIPGVIDWYNTTLSIHIGAGWDKTVYAIYKKQFYLLIKTSPPEVKGMPGVIFTGEGWYDEGALWTVEAKNTTIYVTDDTRYVFVEWDFTETGGGKTSSNPHSWYADRAWNATAVYKLQFKGTWTADPEKLNAKISGWPGEGWFDAYKKYLWRAPSGPIGDLPYDWVFHYWEINGVPQTEFMNQIYINFTGPVTGIAHYKGLPAFFMTPQTIILDAPAECTTFTVNVTAANLEDLYAFDFEVTWDSSLIELVGVDVKVDEIWTSYFIARNETTDGKYWLVATSLDDYGFNGTHTIVSLTFHVIYDPCYLSENYYRKTPIDLKVNQLANSKGEPMYPWNIHGSYYRINAIQPVLHMVPETITVSQKNVEFTIEIWITNAIKLHDWHTIIVYNNVQLQAIDVEINTEFLQGPYVTFSWSIDHANGYVHIDVVQADGAPLANGEGLLATVTFKVIKSIFWTKDNPTLTSLIRFGSPTYISVKCPDYHEIYPDILAVVNCEYTYLPVPGDVNMDGEVNVLDLQLVAADYGSSTTYDLNKDGKVDLLDLVIVAINFGRTKP